MSRKPLPDSGNNYSTGSDCADTPARPLIDQSWKVRHERVNVDGDHLSFVSNATNKVGLYVAAHALSPENSYFEIEIIGPGLETSIGIGLVPDKYRLDFHPGWDEFSVGYHADDGYIYLAVGRGSPFGATCTTGDRMGCGIMFTKSEEEGRQVFFTRNGEWVGKVCVPNPPGSLYPAVGMRSEGTEVRLILDATDWRYNLRWILDKTVQEDTKRTSDRNQRKQIVLNALGMKTWEEMEDSYDQADNMLQFTGDVSTSDGRMQFLTRAFELAKIRKTKWSVQITVTENGLEIPVDKRLIDKYSDQILKEIKRKC